MTVPRDNGYKTPRVLRAEAGVLGRAADAQRRGHRAAGRSPHADQALHRGGGARSSTPTASRPFFLYLAHSTAAHPARALAGLRRPQRRRHVRRRHRGDRLRAPARSSTRSRAAGVDRQHARRVHQRQRAVAAVRDPRRHRRVRCARARARRGKAACGRRRSSGGPARCGRRSSTDIGSAMDLFATAARSRARALPADRIDRRRRPARAADAAPARARAARSSTTGTTSCARFARAATRRTSSPAVRTAIGGARDRAQSAAALRSRRRIRASGATSPPPIPTSSPTS